MTISREDTVSFTKSSLELDAFAEEPSIQATAAAAVDLFFYREPEEAKEQEEAEAPVAPDYGAVAEFIGMGMATSGLLTNGQTWELVPLSLQFLLVTGLLFQNATDGSQHALVVVDGWDAALAPPAEGPVAVASVVPVGGWEASPPATTGWE
ncbi:uncharacterized protein A4U43_C01F6500 [Asparagus officinalis]|uniref:Uncharacterized protein n=1 Tax=Asparagus officinalis TaxID=4686 RepID=A0A5P1FRW2_ASPOF|nr:uncharacterized protein A4U43_C01F6500 [Asparagus officinalis]